MGQGIDYRELLKFYEGKKVLITGNTGFKGSWLTHILLQAGAEVTGYSLKPPTEPNLFNIAEIENNKLLHQYYADVRDLNTLKSVFNKEHPSIVFHLAAQPIVRESYANPVDTYFINVMGTVNVCEAIRLSHVSIMAGGLQSSEWEGVASFLNVTTDKVYHNNEWEWGYRETDLLDGLDPYSNSKSCSELVTHSYRDSFFYFPDEPIVGISTARAGNVIGGGDFSDNRIIPDCVRAITFAQLENKNEGIITVRNPHSIRPYEHVLEPLFVYMLIAAKQYEDKKWSGYYNVGPDDIDCISTGNLVDLFTSYWNGDDYIFTKEKGGPDRIKAVRIDKMEFGAPHEAKFLKLDCSKLKKAFNWTPRWHVKKAIEATIAWTKVWMSGAEAEKIRIEMDREIEEYISCNL